MYTCSLKIVDSHDRRIMLRMANFLGPLGPKLLGHFGCFALVDLPETIWTLRSNPDNMVLGLMMFQSSILGRV